MKEMENRREEDKNIGNQSRRSNIQIMGVLEKEKQNGGNYHKIRPGNFPELKDMSVRIESA